MWRGQTKLQDAIDGADLVRVVRRGLPVTLVIALAVGLLTFGVLSLMPVKHVAEARVTIKSAEAVDRTALSAHSRAISAPPLLSQVAEELRLDRLAQFGGDGDVGIVGRALRLVGVTGAEAQRTTPEAVLGKISQQLRVSPASDEATIVIRFTSDSAKLSAAVVDRLAKTYQKTLAGKPARSAKQELNAVADKIDQSNSKLSLVDGEIAQLTSKIAALRNGSGEASVNLRRLTKLKAELTRAEAVRARTESQWQRARDLTRQGKVDAVPQLQQSPAIRRLIGQRARQEQKLAKAQEKLLPAHPRIKRLKADVTKVKQQLRQQVRNFIRGLEKEFRTAAFKVQDIERDISGLQSKVVDISDDEAKLRRLQSQAGELRLQQQQLAQQFESKKQLIASQPPPVEAQIIQPARLVARSGQIPKAPYTLAAMAVAFALGLGLITTKDVVSRGGLVRREAKAVEEDVPSLSMATVAARLNLPMSNLETTDAETAPSVQPTVTDPDPQPSLGAPPQQEEVFRLTSVAGIADHLLDRGQEVAGFRSMLVGQTGGVDPAEVGMELARALSEAGAQVVVIDWNVQANRFARAIGVGEYPGVSELLSGEARFEDIIANVPNSRVHYINAGAGLDSGDPRLDEEGLNLVLDALDEAYDQIVVIGRFAAAQELFEIVQGRFDAGIVVSAASSAHEPQREPANTFLGFEVTDIDIIHYRCSAPIAPAAPERQMELA